MEWFQPLEPLGMDARTGQPDVIKPFYGIPTNGFLGLL
jgi:hypothetical protein